MRGGPRSTDTGSCLGEARLPSRVPAAELAVGAGLLAGLPAAAWCAAALLSAFTLVLAAELARGSAPPSCACLPWSGRPGRLTLVRNAVLVAAALATAEGAVPHLGRAFWEASYAVLWLAVAALVVLVLSLYRQVGVLHLRLGPRGALEEEGEGPELGTAVDHPAVPAGRAALVAFTSAGCPVCHQIVPGLRVLERDPALRVVHAAYEDAEGPELHAAFDVPGTPYAVYLDAAGVVRAKGTVNTLERAREPGRRRRHSRPRGGRRCGVTARIWRATWRRGTAGPAS